MARVLTVTCREGRRRPPPSARPSVHGKVLGSRGSSSSRGSLSSLPPPPLPPPCLVWFRHRHQHGLGNVGDRVWVASGRPPAQAVYEATRGQGGGRGSVMGKRGGNGGPDSCRAGPPGHTCARRAELHVQQPPPPPLLLTPLRGIASLATGFNSPGRCPADPPGSGLREAAPSARQGGPGRCAGREYQLALALYAFS